MAIVQQIDALEADIHLQPGRDGKAVGQKEALGDGDGGDVLDRQQAPVGGVDGVAVIAPLVQRRAIVAQAGEALRVMVAAIVEPQAGRQRMAPAL
jgi:hypothetical protein